MQSVWLCIREAQREAAVLVSTTAALVHSMGPVKTTLLEVRVHRDQSQALTSLREHLCHRGPARRDNATSANVTPNTDNVIYFY